MVLVALSGGAFVVSFLARDAPAVEIAAVVAYGVAVATALFALVKGSRGRAAAIACLVLAAPIGLAILGLVVTRLAYNAEGAG